MDSPIHLVVGLGNPGAKYEATRHNAGFWLLEQLARRFDGRWAQESKFFGRSCRARFADRECRLLMPETFMNHSGQSVSSVANYFKIPPQSIVVAHDELDLPAGAIRLKRGGGVAGHNGLRDIVKAIGSPDFLRIRIGIGRPGANVEQATTDYVLGTPSRADEQAIRDRLDTIVELFPDLVAGRAQEVMNTLHSLCLEKESKSTEKKGDPGQK